MEPRARADRRAAVPVERQLAEVDRVVGNTEKFDLSAWRETQAAFARSTFGNCRRFRSITVPLMRAIGTALMNRDDLAALRHVFDASAHEPVQCEILALRARDVADHPEVAEELALAEVDDDDVDLAGLRLEHTRVLDAGQTGLHLLQCRLYSSGHVQRVAPRHPSPRFRC